jgi:UDP-glucose 4-epimerase
MITSLVTGGAGFIGSHVAKHCLNLGHKVIVLDDLSGGFEDHVPAGVEFIIGSINDVELLEGFCRKA